MDDNQLIALAASLEAESAEAKTHIKRCNPHQMASLTANRAGFMRLAASCLQAAAAPIAEEDYRSRAMQILPPHDQIVDHDSDLIIGFLQRMETWPESNEYLEARKKRALRNDNLALLTCGVMASILLFIIVAGITAIAGWFRS